MEDTLQGVTFLVNLLHITPFIFYSLLIGDDHQIIQNPFKQLNRPPPPHKMGIKYETFYY